MMMMKFMRSRVDDDDDQEIISGGNNNTICSSVSTTDVVVVAVEAAEEEDINNPNYNSAAAVPCPSCGNIPIITSGSERNQLLDNKAMDIHRLPGLPAGVKFDPTDQELLEHLEAKVRGSVDDGISMSKLHPLLDQFIPTIQGEEGICYTHPQKLPGVSKDGSVRHFFHCPSKAYTTGTRKRRKVQSDEQGGETRWHKTGKTRPILISGRAKAYKKILVLYTNYGRLKKPQKTNWVMHQYHLGSQEEEKEGELVVSKVFYQTQPRQCGASNTQKLLSPKAKYHTSIIIHESNTHQFIDRYESMSLRAQMGMDNDMNQDTHRNTTQDTTLNHASDSSSTHQLQAPQIHTKLPLQVDASTYPL